MRVPTDYEKLMPWEFQTNVRLVGGHFDFFVRYHLIGAHKIALQEQ
jgi:hypothetical protein